MIQVLIAEDEALTRIGLRFCLDQENSDYALVGEAENGQQALEMCIKLKPQILITDIKMPVMDGIELIRQIKARNLDIKIIILTCYEEFTYLHEAMHLGVDDYLLKVGLKPDRMLEVLDKVREKYFEGGTSAPAASESRLEALESIIMGYIDEEDEINRLVSAHHLDLKFNRYALLIVEAERRREISRSYHRGNMLNRGIRAMLTDCINMETHGEVAQCEFGRFVAFVHLNEAQDDAQARDTLNKLAQRMTQVGHQSLNIDLTIGISDLYSGISGLATAQMDAERALNRSLFGDGEAACPAEEAERDETAACSETLRLELKRIHDAIYIEDEQAMQTAVDHFCDAIKAGNLRESDARSWFMRAYMTAVSSFEDKTGMNLDSQEKLQSLKRMMIYASSLREISNEIQRMIGEIARHFENSASGQSNALIHQVIAFCDAHYGENLTLEYISKKFGINVTYFCKLFKRVMGMTFVEYLTNCRINEAKRLIHSTDLPNYMIAQQTGFQNPEYFSKIFKKQTGMTPKEYKRSREQQAPNSQKL